MEPKKCLRCGGLMSHGAVSPDPHILQYGARRAWQGQVVWQALEDVDRSPPGFFGLPHLKNPVPVYAFRCDDCGWLEFFALHSVPRRPPTPPPIQEQAAGEAATLEPADGDEGDSEL
jgi:hypothetical protein